jgi:hypothetical protein
LSLAVREFDVSAAAVISAEVLRKSRRVSFSEWSMGPNQLTANFGLTQSFVPI